MEKKNTVAKKQTGKAPADETAGEVRDDAAQGAGEGAYYKSQKEVDAAFARRLEAERRKWARQQEAIRLLEAAGQAQAGSAQLPNVAAQAGMPVAAGAALQPGGMGMQAPGIAAQPGAVPGLPGVPQALQGLPEMAQAAPGMAGNMPVAQGMPQSGLPAQPGMPQAMAQQPQAGQQAQDVPGLPGVNPQDAAAQRDTNFAEVALRLLSEEADIQQVFPQFDLESFLALGEGVQNALLSGKSLWSVFFAVYGDSIRRQAEDSALERIRDRNANVPDVLRNGGAAGSVGLDYANMPSEQFQKLRKAYEAEMRTGKKVKP